MSNEEWIRTQLHGGKSDSQIISMLAQNGWKDADAKAALQSVKSQLPRKATATEQGILAAAVLGIWLLITYHAFNTQPQPGNPLVISTLGLLVAGALALLAWALYVLAVPHNHPGWRRPLFLYTALVVAAGAAAWMLLASAVVLRLFGVMINTLGLSIILGVAFAISIIILEYTFSALRHVHDGTALRSIKRLSIVGAVLAVICIVAVAATINTLQYKAVERFNQANDQTDGKLYAAMQEKQILSMQQLKGVPNPILAARFSGHIDKYEATRQNASLTLGESLFDTAWKNHCDELLGRDLAQVSMLRDVQLFDDYRTYLRNTSQPRVRQSQPPFWVPDLNETIRPAPLGVQYKYMESAHACAVREFDEYMSDLLVAPKGKDAASKEFAAFLAWRRGK